MGPEGTLPCLQQPETRPYSMPDKSHLRPPILLFYDQLQYYLPIYIYVLEMVSFLQVFPPKP